jgi:hypothetical protein
MMALTAAESVASFGEDRDAAAKTGLIDERHCPFAVARRRSMMRQFEIHPTSLHPTTELAAANDALFDQVLVYELAERS